MELAIRRSHGDQVVECVDNDETAAVIANLVHTKKLVLMTSTEGHLPRPHRPQNAGGAGDGEKHGRAGGEGAAAAGKLRRASRAGANGAKAKLEYALKSARQGTMVIIGHARHRLSDLAEGRVACTRIGLE